MPPTTTRPAAEWLLLGNAHVITLDDRSPAAGSVLVGDHRIQAVFDSPRPDLTLSTARVRRLDLQGRTVLPAFTDSHIHLMEWGITLGQANLEHARSPEEVARDLAAFHKDKPVRPGEWVVGRGWSHNQWPNPIVPASTELLDGLFPDNPVILHSMCGHLAWANTAALRVAGITANTEESFPGGEITKNPETGEPTGILKEEAISIVDKARGIPSVAARREALQRAIREAHANGIVAVHAVEPLETFQLMEQARLEDQLDLRVAFYLPVAAIDDVVSAGIRSFLGDDRLKIGGLKLFTDGSLGGRTAWMLEPYLEDPPHTGIPILHGAELHSVVLRANRNGLSCAIHAIGDRAVRETLEAYAVAWKELEGSSVRPFLRNRIEHFQTVHPDDLRYLRDMPVAACMQPVHLFADWRAADRFFGPERARWTYPCRTLSESGACLALGSDAPVATVSVPTGIYSAVWRRDLEGQPEGGWVPEERISMLDALKAYCSAAPAIVLEENRRGRIEPGLLADLVVLDTDPLTATPEAMLNTQIVATLFDGRWVFGGEAIEG